MNLQLAGKRILVTGSTAGIGLAIATELAQENAEVVVNGRTAARVAQLHALLDECLQRLAADEPAPDDDPA